MKRTTVVLSVAWLSYGSLLGCFTKTSDFDRERSSRESPAKIEGSLHEPMARERHEYLELELTNNTGGQIDQTSVSFGTNQCTFGILGEGGSKAYLGWSKPVGTNALVRWREVQRTVRTANVNLTGTYDPSIPGVLKFDIRGDNVTVAFKRIQRP